VRNTSHVANGGRFRARLYAMMAEPEKSVFNRWARCVGAFYIAVAALLIAVATIAMPAADKSDTATLRSVPAQAVAKSVPSMLKPEVIRLTTQ
jgi:hypothetical protein